MRDLQVVAIQFLIFKPLWIVSSCIYHPRRCFGFKVDSSLLFRQYRNKFLGDIAQMFAVFNH